MIRLTVALVLASTLGWAAFWVVVRLDLFETAPVFRQAVFAAGMVVTAIALVVVLATFILKVLLKSVLHVEPSGLARALVYSGLTFVATFVLLSQFGVDVGAILTTSAILGAVVGLSMQSTLGSIISGLSMSAEPLLKIGSAIKFEDRTVRIEEKTWRHIVGRRLDNIRVIIPNSMLANMPILVFPEDGPTRFDVFLNLPPDIPPQRISDLLSTAFTDIEHLDATRSVEVSPIETQPESDSIVYRLRLWARVYSQITILQGEVPRRAWYVLDRAGIHQPRNLFFESPQWPRPRPEDLAKIIGASVPGIEPRDLAGDVRQYRFAPTELLLFPHQDQGRRMMLLQGETSSESDLYLNPLEHGRSARPHLPKIGVQQLSTMATIRKIADLLARDVGPVAEGLVREAIKTTKDGLGLVHRLAESIQEDGPRARFVTAAAALIRNDVCRGPGTIATLGMDAAGRTIPDPELRALTEVLVVTFPFSPSAA